MAEQEYTFVDKAGNLFFAPEDMPKWWRSGEFVKYQKNKKNPNPNLIFWHRDSWSQGCVKIPDGLLVSFPKQLPAGRYDVLKQSEECIFVIKIADEFERTAKATKPDEQPQGKTKKGDTGVKDWENAPDLSNVKNLNRQDYAWAFMQGVNDFIHGKVSLWKWQTIRGDLLTIVKEWDLFKPPRQSQITEDVDTIEKLKEIATNPNTTDAAKIAAIKELARKEPKTNKERHIEDIIVDTEPASEPEEEIEVEIK